MQKMLAVKAANRYQSVMELKQDLKAYGLIGGVAVPQIQQAQEVPQVSQTPQTSQTPQAPPLPPESEPK